MWLKRKPKKGDLWTLGRSHFVLIADYELHCWTCICNAFSCARFNFPIDHPPFSSFRKLFRRFVFQITLSSWHYWHINHITLLVFFFTIPSLIAVLLIPIYFYADTFSSPLTLIWSETSLFFRSPVRLKSPWKYKSLLSGFDHVFSTIPNILVRFDRLVIIMNFEDCSSLEYLVISTW